MPDENKFRMMLQDLISDDPERASPSLEFMATQGTDSYPALFRALEDDDPRLRQAAAVASLTLSHPLGAGLTPALRVCLDDPEPEVRIAAAQALMIVSPEPSDVDPCLQTVIDLLSNLNCIAYALPLLKAFPPVQNAAPEDLIDCLDHKDPDLAIQAAQAIATVFPKSIDCALDLLKKLMKSPLLRTRCHSALALADMRTAAAPAVKSLIEMLEDVDGTVRSAALTALGCIASEGEQVIPALVRYLEDPNDKVKIAAAVALGRFEDEASAEIVRGFCLRVPPRDGLLFIALSESCIDVTIDVLARLEAYDDADSARPSVIKALRRKVASEFGPPEVESELPKFIIVYRRLDNWIQRREKSIGALIILSFVALLLCLMGWATGR